MRLEDLRLLTIENEIDLVILQKKSLAFSSLQEIRDIPFKYLFWFLERIPEWHTKQVWVWLSLPQLWISKRWIIVSYKWHRIVMINPEIISHSEDKNCVEYEGCLSEPWIKVQKKRRNRIEVRYFDINFEPMVSFYKWMISRIIQHEIDHLDWLLLSDDRW